MKWTSKLTLTVFITGLFLMIGDLLAYAVRFPTIYYFPLKPDFSFSLISERSNTVDVTERIELPGEDDNPDIFFVNWLVKLSLDNQKLIYSLRFQVETNGDISLSEMKDQTYQFYFDNKPLIFPRKYELNSPVSIGENVTWKYTKTLASLKEKNSDKVYNNVVIADFTFMDKTIQIFFAEENGIVGIKSGDEIFRRK